MQYGSRLDYGNLIYAAFFKVSCSVLVPRRVVSLPLETSN